MEGYSVNTPRLPSWGEASKGREDSGHQPPTGCALKNPLVLQLQSESSESPLVSSPWALTRKLKLRPLGMRLVFVQAQSLHTQGKDSNTSS